MKVKSWQTHLAIWGTLFWFASFRLMELANDAGLKEVSHAIFGYMLGFITTFVGYLFWEHVHDRWKLKIFDEPLILETVN